MMSEATEALILLLIAFAGIFVFIWVFNPSLAFVALILFLIIFGIVAIIAVARKTRVSTNTYA